MNKSELIAAMAAKTGETKKDAEAALNAFVSVVTEALVKGDKVQLVGFGSFEVRKRAARKGRNPQTKEEIKKELFLLADELEELAINGKTADGNRVRIYVSNINFEATYSYVDTNNLQLSLIRIYSINSITTMDNEIFCTLKEWIQSLKKFSTLISESGEMQRIQFFKQQREIIDAL